MKRNVTAALFILVSLLTVSCSKMDQLFNNGEPVTERRELDSRFDAISMYNNVSVKLVRSNQPHLVLTCPKNLIEKVTTEIEGDMLVIKNENDHNWLRSYDYEINLTVYYDSLYAINYASIGDLTCVDSIWGYGETSIDSTELGVDTVTIRSINLNINEGCGKIDLAFKSNVVKCIFGNGTSEVTLKGRSAYTEIIMRSYGVVHAEELNSNFVRVQSTSTNDAYVWARTKLTVWLHSIGNVYYKGHPSSIVKECTNEGQVIPL
jgi:hypothetical protein